jgi:hypothetical protein
VFGKAIHWFFILIAVVSAWVIVGVLLPDHFSLLVIEQLNGRIYVLEPLVPVYLFDGESLLWVDLQQTSEKVSSFNGDVILQCVFSLDDQLVQFIHVVSFEGNCSIEHCE